MGDGGRRERGGMGKGEAGERSEAIGEIYGGRRGGGEA